MCGESTPFDARFCPQCGTRLDVEVVDLTGPADERDSSTPSEPPRANRLLVGLGAAVVLALAGLWILSGDDTPNDDEAADDEPAEVETPSASPDAAAVPATEQTLESILSIRPRFAEVEEMLRPGDVASIGLISQGDTLFWLTGDYLGSTVLGTEPQIIDPRVRRSDDAGATWIEVVHDLPTDARFGPATESAGELVVAGTDPAGALTVWRSSDGAAWVAETVEDQAAPPGQFAVPTGLHPSPDGLVLLTTHAPDMAVFDPILPADSTHVVAIEGGLLGGRVDFVGPMGIRIEGPALDDPAIDDQMRAALELGDSRIEDRTGAIWMEGADGWTGAMVDGLPMDMTVLADGSPLVIGFTGTGATEWTLDDQGQWHSDSASPDLMSITTWRGQTIATGSGDLRVRTESGAWEPYGLFNALPTTLQGGFLASAVGDADILAVSVLSTGQRQAVSPPGPALLAKDGFVLSYAISRGVLAVTTPSDERIEMAPWQPSRPSGVSVDPSGPALVVADPGSDAETAFTFAELAQLEQAARTVGVIFEEAEVLVSVDGQTWARADLPESSFATQLLPVGDSVLTVVGRFGAPYAGLSTDEVRLLRVSYS